MFLTRRRVSRVSRVLRFAAALSLAGAITGATARAGDEGGAPDGDGNSGRLVVVELFTSQGCSSCPPADAFLNELADRSDVLALSLHVDYWDYLGWKDIYAQPAFTRRQVAYGELAGARSVYTPQMVVEGVKRLVGSRRDAVLAAIDDAEKAPRLADIDISRKEHGLSVHVRPLPAAEAPPAGVLWYVTYHTPDPAPIKRGENAGQKILYRNVARSWMLLGRWDGKDAKVFAAPEPAGQSSDSGVAVILQQGRVGPILAAAQLTD